MNAEKDLKFLFVCAGNTCRGPMAEAVFNKKAKELGLRAEAFSAGIYGDGKALTKKAGRALRNRGIEGFEHTSVKITNDMCKEADYVVGMTEELAIKVAEQFPVTRKKIYDFPVHVINPFGLERIGLGYYVFECILDKIIKGVDIIIATVYGV